MTKRFILIVAILYTMFAVMQTKAACPTPPDCPSDTWTTVTVTETIGGCLVTYTYCWRNACGVYKDFYLDSFNWPIGCTPSITVSEITDIIEKKILYANPWGGAGLPPCPAMSVPIYRFYAGQCYYTCPITDIMYIRWCNPEALCYQVYRACNGAGGPTGWTGIEKQILSSGTWSSCFEKVADCECDGNAEQKIRD